MRRGWLPGVVVAVLLAAAAVAARFATLDLRVEQGPGVIATRPPPQPVLGAEGSDASRSTGDGPAVLGPVVVAVLLLALLAAAVWAGWLLLRRLRRSGGHRGWYRLRALRPATSRPAGPLDGDRLLAAVDEAVARSEDDRDPRRAVIACWVRLAEAAADAGIPRHESDTATDLVVRLLRTYHASEPVLAAFAEAYWLARYATHTVDEQMRTQARSSLRRLRGELRGEVSVS
jgi:hypothetical protein